MNSKKIRAFQKVVLDFHKTHGRHALPWRKTKDAYKILVSEVMLQQTQVERVVPFYKEWLKKFPNVKTLAAAPLADVLRLWQGLGYNRRAKMLHEAAKKVVREQGGKLPRTIEDLTTLPGIGPYTARAVLAFSENQDVEFIETNIRTVVIHHFFNDTKEKVPDKEILEILKQALPKGNARIWYAALMDYGSHLKRSGLRLNTRGTTYTKQSKFSGSAREARGAILKALVHSPRSGEFLTDLFGADRRAQMRSQLSLLVKEGMVELKSRKFQLPS